MGSGQIDERRGRRLDGETLRRDVGRAARYGIGALRRVPWGLWLLLAAGCAVRLWFLWSYRPAFVGYPDSRAYVVSALGTLFDNQYRPGGYAQFLRLVHELDARASFVVVAQHALGIATALLLYATARRFTTRRWPASIPAAIVLLAGPQVFLEHAILAEALYTFLLAAAVFAVALAVGADVRRAWPSLALAGALLGAATATRSVGLVLVPVLGLWLATRRAEPWRRRAVGVLALLLGAAATLVPYLVVQHGTTGQWGLTRTQGMTLYARVAPFADCSAFDPPSGTEQLCERTPAAEREGPTWYMFHGESPLLRTFGGPPYPGPGTPRRSDAYRYAPDDQLGAFARAAVLHQPLDYLGTVADGLLAYVAPGAARRSMVEFDSDTLVSALHERSVEEWAAPIVTTYFATPPGFTRNDVGALDAYGRWARVEGPVTVVLLAFGLFGWAAARGRRGSGASLAGWTTACLAVAPVLLLFYGARYATPMYGFLGLSAAFGAEEAWTRWSAWRTGRASRLRTLR